MTWDASLMRLPKGMTLSEMAEKYGNDFRLSPIGSTADVGNTLMSLFPDAKHVDGQTVLHEGYAYVQFNYSDRSAGEAIQSIHVVSNGDKDSIAVIKMVCDRLDLCMVDHQSGEIADFDKEPQRSMEVSVHQNHN